MRYTFLCSGIKMNKADKGGSFLSLIQNCWPNSVMCDYRNKVPISLLVVSLSSTRLSAFLHCPFHLQTSKEDVFPNFESLASSATSILTPAGENSLVQELMLLDWVHSVTPDNLSKLKSATLFTSVKSLFLMFCYIFADFQGLECGHLRREHFVYHRGCG